MKRSEQDHLISELLAGEEISGFRETSLSRGIEEIRRRNRLRRRARACFLAGAPLALLLAFLARTALEAPAPRPVPPAPIQVSAVSTRPAEVVYINDDELLALFPNRSVALIGKPGQQQLLFLDAARLSRLAE
jgi:hypothetical protein